MRRSHIVWISYQQNVPVKFILFSVLRKSEIEKYGRWLAKNYLHLKFAVSKRMMVIQRKVDDVNFIQGKYVIALEFNNFSGIVLMEGRVQLMEILLSVKLEWKSSCPVWLCLSEQTCSAGWSSVTFCQSKAKSTLCHIFQLMVFDYAIFIFVHDQRTGQLFFTPFNFYIDKSVVVVLKT